MGVHQGQKKLKFVGKINGQIRIQIERVRGFGCSSPTGKEGEGRGGHTLSAGETPDEELARAAPVTCRRRLAACEEGGRARERGERERGRERGEEEGPGNLTFFFVRERTGWTLLNMQT